MKSSKITRSLACATAQTWRRPFYAADTAAAAPRARAPHRLVAPALLDARGARRDLHTHAAAFLDPSEAEIFEV